MFVQVVAVARGLYDVTFVPVSREPHRVSVTFNEQPVPGSPFVCRVSEPHTYVQIGNILTSAFPCFQNRIIIFLLDTQYSRNELRVR